MSTPPIVDIRAQYLQEEAHPILFTASRPVIKAGAGEHELFDYLKNRDLCHLHLRSLICPECSSHTRQHDIDENEDIHQN